MDITNPGFGAMSGAGTSWTRSASTVSTRRGRRGEPEQPVRPAARRGPSDVLEQASVPYCRPYVVDAIAYASAARPLTRSEPAIRPRTLLLVRRRVRQVGYARALPRRAHRRRPARGADVRSARARRDPSFASGWRYRRRAEPANPPSMLRTRWRRSLPTRKTSKRAAITASLDPA